ncbi:MAG: hypothetical protein C4320_03385 [Armatimonadota bacterium]
MGADRVKALPLQSALADLESRLTTFGQSFETKFRSISEYMMTPVYRAEASLKKLTDTVEERRNTWRFRLWPDFYTVLLEESIRTGQKKLAELRAQARVITRILESAEKGDPRAFAKVGVMMANTAAIRDLVDYDAQLLEAVEQARAKVRHERKQLDPGRFPSS